MRILVFDLLEPGKLLVTFDGYEQEEEVILIRKIGTLGGELHRAFGRKLNQSLRGMTFVISPLGKLQYEVTYPQEAKFGVAASIFYNTLSTFVRRLEVENEEYLDYNVSGFVRGWKLIPGHLHEEALFIVSLLTPQGREDVAVRIVQLDTRD